MNLKNTGICLLVAGALGTLAFMGCTITSNTSNDFDGGTTPPITNPNPPQPDKDASTDSGFIPACTSNQERELLNPACQACVEKSCCNELKGCFDMVVAPESGKLDCNAYSECISDCGADGVTDAEACYKECDDTAAPGIQAAFEAVVTCGLGDNAKCKTECADGTTPVDSDAGADAGADGG